MTIKRFRLKLSGRPAGETVVIKVSECDAYLLRSHVWTATLKGGSLTVQRTVALGMVRHLGRYIMDCPADKYVRHRNGDSRDFTRQNLLVANDMRDVGVVSRRLSAEVPGYAMEFA